MPHTDSRNTLHYSVVLGTCHNAASAQDTEPRLSTPSKLVEIQPFPTRIEPQDVSDLTYISCPRAYGNVIDV